MVTNEFQPVVCAFIQRNGRWLLTRKRVGTSAAGYWEFPGGKVKPGELPETALKREMAEEFGMQIRPEPGIVCKIRHKSFELLALKAEWLSGPSFFTDHDALVWISPDEITLFPMQDSETELARQFFEKQQ